MSDIDNEGFFEQPTEQEPVGITITGKLGNIYSFTSDYSLKKGDKVYTSPPQPQEAASHEPLTDEEIDEIGYKVYGMKSSTDRQYARAIEAAHAITGEKE